MKYNNPFRAGRRKDLEVAAYHSPTPPNFDYFAEAEPQRSRTGRLKRPARSLQRTQLSGDSSGSRQFTPRKLFNRKTSMSPITLKQHFRNRLPQTTNAHVSGRMRSKRFVANDVPKHSGRPPEPPEYREALQQLPAKPKYQHGRRKKQLFLWKEQQIKWNLQQNALQIYQIEVYTQQRNISDPSRKKRAVEQYLKSRRSNSKNILYPDPPQYYQDSGVPNSLCQNLPQTPRKSQDDTLPQSPPMSPTQNFDRLVSFKQPSLVSIKISQALIVPEIPSYHQSLTQQIFTAERPPIQTFGNLPTEQFPFIRQKSAIKVVNNTPPNEFVMPANTQPIRTTAQPATAEPFDQSNPYQYPKQDSASGSGSSKSLKLESNISRRIMRRVGGRSRISSKIINISTIRNSKISHNTQFQEMLEKMQLHIDVINRIVEYVEESGNLYGQTVWRCQNFMLYKRYYMERLRIQETLNGHRNCFTLSQVDIKKDVLLKYLNAVEVRLHAQQLNQHNNQIRTCLEQLHGSLRIRVDNHPTLNVLFDRLSTSRLHQDIISAFAREFAALRRLYPTEPDEQRRAAIQQRLIDIVQLTYLLEELSDNFVRSFVECQDIDSFEEFLQTNEPVFAAIVKKYSRPS